MQTRGGGDKASIFSFCFVVTPVFFFLFCLLSNFTLFLSKSIVIHEYIGGMIHTVSISDSTRFMFSFSRFIIRIDQYKYREVNPGIAVIIRRTSWKIGK